MSAAPKAPTSTDTPVNVFGDGFDKDEIDGVITCDTITFRNTTSKDITLNIDPGLTTSTTLPVRAGSTSSISVTARNGSFTITDAGSPGNANDSMTLKIKVGGGGGHQPRPHRR